MIKARLAVLTALLALAACSSQEEIVEDDFNFDGTCANCHVGLSAKQVHPTFKLRCVDCHGGNDQVEVPENAFEDESIYRDPALLEAAHVRPKEGLARFFWANGIDDDGDGEIDEVPIIEAGVVVDFGEIAEFGLQGEGIGEFIDAEFNRDLNYLRWINPGDLRVATVSCGSSSRPALDGEAGGACHQSIIDTNRRSIMVNQSAVINGAYYGNESWRATFQDARDANAGNADPRSGAFGYTLDYTNIDDCIDTSGAEGEDGRGQPRFDSACLEDRAAANDPNAGAGGPGNTGIPGENLPAFEVTQGTIVGSAPGTEPGETIAHRGVKNGRIEWGGKPLLDPAAPLAQMDPVPDDDLIAGVVPDPVDNVLRGFRAYYPLNYPGSSNNFNFTFGESIKPGIDEHKTQNPFGRGHGSGCTACHMAYNYDGSRNAQRVFEFDAAGTLIDAVVADPTTKHREFDPETQDIVNVDGRDRLIGMTVNGAIVDGVPGERDIDGDGEFDREQQRFYSANHNLTAQITTDQCGLCHAFVTRINFAYQGMGEDEQRDRLAREKPIEFTTPAGTRVAILDSWVREQLIDGGNIANDEDFELIVPAGDAIAKLAEQRNRDLEAQGLLPGAGGCAASVFSEDCNNNGELDRELVLQRFDENGRLVAEATIDEDLNGNGRLDLLSHAPRNKSLDGRQPRYVYGGANGSTRLMDIHFERGMHCIDCHMIQDTHGDGNLYSTNWEAMEIECEDCHGATERATLFTSGPNGGNDLTKAVGNDRRPFFERKGDKLIQRSRVTPGVFWELPQVPDTIDPGSPDFNPRAITAHDVQHLPVTVAPGEHNVGSVFAGEQGSSELQVATLECYACHTAWVHNCMGCHFNTNLGDNVKQLVDTDGSIIQVAGENETWFNNKNQAARSNFQLLSLLRSPFVLGTNAAADGGRLAPFRSSMEVHVSVTDAGGDTLLDNMTFTTFQEVDANSGRANVATSGAAMNQTMPHTVRPLETQGCESCHGVVDQQSRVLNDHIVAQTYGIGAGRYPYVGDWAMVAGPGLDGGLELFEYKAEAELAGANDRVRFPGLIVDPNAPTLANVEPLFDGGEGIDATFEGTGVAFVRNFQPAPSGVQLAIPTLRDLTVTSVASAVAGALVISDVTFRGHPDLSARSSTGDTTSVFVLDLPDRALGVAHLTPDVSDPFVYVANAGAGLSVVELLDAPVTGGTAADLVTTVSAGGNTATAVRLVGDVAYVGTAEGTVEIFDLSDPRAPERVGNGFDVGAAVNAIDIGGFTIYVATDDGIRIFNNVNLTNPFEVASALEGTVASGIFFSGGHLYVAAGADGVLDLDVTVPGDPQNLGDLAAERGETVNATDVTVSVVPGQTWVLASDANGDLVGLKLDNSLSTHERCVPDTAACKSDMDFRDPVIMGRDPSLIGANLQPDPDDPSAPPAFRIVSSILNGGGRFARPALWEQIGTQTGRRVRDSFMPGSGVLSEAVMQRMYLIQLCEIPDSESVNGSGWGQFGEANSDFFASGNCQPIDGGGGGGDEEEEEEDARQASLVCDPGDSRGLCLGTDDAPVEVAAPLLSDATGR